MKWLDQAFERSAVDLSQRLSRRRFMTQTGKTLALAAFAGGLVKFMWDALTPKAVAQTGTCGAHIDCAGVGSRCDNFSAECGCPGCLQPDGCPDGTVQGAGWLGCCPCNPEQLTESGDTKGTQVFYQDCCGTVPMGEGDPCVGCSAGPSLPNADRFCQGSAANLPRWCDDQGTYQCTTMVDQEHCCVGEDPSEECNFA